MRITTRDLPSTSASSFRLAVGCPNCASAGAGVYCPQCGQRTAIARLSVGELVANGLRVVTDADRGLLPTLRDLTLRPAAMCRNYIGGQRRRYINPISYFLLVATLQFIDFYLSEDALTDMLSESLREAAAVQGLEANEAAIAEQAASTIDNLMSFGTYGIFFFVCIPYALLLRLAHWRARWNLAELSVVAIFTVSHSMLITSLLSLITLNISFQLYSVVTLSVFAIMAVWVGVTFFGRWWHGVSTLVIFAVCYAFNSFMMALLHALFSA